MVYENGIYRDMTTEEKTESEAVKRSYWLNVPYDEAVNAEIRKRYTESQEFAILRQRDEKPEEYAAYYAYCESCKSYVKEQVSRYSVTV